MAIQENLIIIRRDDQSIEIAVKDSAGAAIDITGYTFFLTVKRKNTDPDSQALIASTVSSHTNPTAGYTVFDLTKTDTDVTPGRYPYDIQMKDAGGKVQTFIGGYAEVKQDITVRVS